MRTANPDSPTKEKMVEAALKLMLSKGYVATTVDEICSEAKVTKGSFFHYFKNKEDLGKQLVDHFSQCMGQTINEGLCKCGTDPLEKLYGFIDCISGMADDPSYKGCLVGTFTQEISDTHPELRSLCQESLSKVSKFVTQLLIEAKEEYPPKKDFNPEEVAQYFVALGQGTHILVKASQDRGIMRQNLMLFKDHLKALFGK